MADEIQVRWGLTVAKGNLSRRIPTTTTNITLAASSPAVSGGAYSAGTTHEAIPLGDLAAVGVGWIKNLDGTNYMEVGVEVSATFYPFLKLKPGESFPFRLGTSAPYVKANTAACKYDFEIYDN